MRRRSASRLHLSACSDGHLVLRGRMGSWFTYCIFWEMRTLLNFLRIIWKFTMRRDLPFRMARPIQHWATSRQMVLGSDFDERQNGRTLRLEIHLNWGV